MFTKETNITGPKNGTCKDLDGHQTLGNYILLDRAPQYYSNRRQVRMSAEKNIEFNEFMETTSMHGVKYLNTPGWFRRIFWSLLLVCATALLVRQIREQIIQLRDSPVSTNVKLVYEPMLRFPSITICNGNEMRITEIAKYDAYGTLTFINHIVQKTELLEKYFQTDFAKLHNKQFSVDENDADFFKQMKVLNNGVIADLNNLDAHFADSREFSLAAAHLKDDMIMSCTTNSGEPCEVKKLMNDFGVCYSINYNISHLSTAKIPGFSENFLISLNVESYQNVKGKFPYAGFKVLLHDNHEWPLVDSRGLNIPAGKATMLALKRYETSLLTIEKFGRHGSCIKSFPLVYFDESQFSFDTCINDIKYRMIVEACGCVPFMVPKASDFTNDMPNMCSVSKHFLCVLPLAFARGNRSILWDEYKGMRRIYDEIKDCYESCDRGRYDATLTQLRLDDNFMDQLSPANRSRIRNTYDLSMEAKARHEPKEFKADQSLISAIEKNMETAQSLKIAPYPADSYWSSKRQLEAATPCYKALVQQDIVKLMTEILLDSQNNEDDSLISDIELKQLAYKKYFLNAIMPQEWITDLVDVHNNVTNASDIEADIQKHFLSMMTFFADIESLDRTVTEHVIDGSRFENAISDMRLYGMGNITKQEWARRHTAKSEDLGGDYRANVIDPLTNNLRRMQQFLTTTFMQDYGNLTEFMSASDDLTSGEALWKYVHYSMVITHPKHLLALVDNNGTCTVEKMQELMSKMKEYDILVLNDTFIEGIAGECNLTNVTKWEEFNMRSVIQSAYSCLRSTNNTLEQLKERASLAAAPLSANMSLLDDKLKQYYDNFKKIEHIYTDNLAQIAIYYRDMTKEILIQQNTYNIWGLFCDVGGTLGLFLGASVMTFCEFLDWTCMKVMACRNYVRMKSTNKEEDEIEPVPNSGASVQLNMNTTADTGSLQPAKRKNTSSGLYRNFSENST